METEHKTMNTPANQQRLIAGKTVQQYRAEVGSPDNFDSVLHTLHTKCNLSVSQAVAVGVKGWPSLYAEYRKAKSAGR